jgi:large subunit ribosomal protein L7Ae
MPTLCAKKNIPFVIVKSKARLGSLVHKKTASCVALSDVTPGDQEEFDKLATQARRQYNDRLTEMRRRWGNRVLGIKTRHKIEKRLRLRQQEATKRKEAQKAKDE